MRTLSAVFTWTNTADRPDSVTIATQKSQTQRVAEMMAEHHFKLVEQEPYYRTVFATYVPTRNMDQEELLTLFAKVKTIVYEGGRGQ